MRDPIGETLPSAGPAVSSARPSVSESVRLGFALIQDTPEPCTEVDRLGAFRTTRASPLDVELADPLGRLRPGARVTLHLTAPGLKVGPIEGRVAEAKGETPETRRVDFDAPDLPLARAVLALLRTLSWRGILASAGHREEGIVESIDDPSRIRAILTALFAWRIQGRMTGTDGRTLSVWPSALRREGELPLTWHTEERAPDPPLHMELGAYNSAFVFRIERARRQGDDLLTELPTLVARRRTRRHRRSPAPVEAWIRFRHPLWPELEVRRPLRDLSLAGLSFSTQSVRDALFPGLELPEVEVCWPRLGRVRLSARVRHVSEGTDDEGELCGLAVVPAPDAAERWHAGIDRLFNPNTEEAPDHAEALWDLFRHSGYFNLSGSTPADFAILKEAFLNVHAILPRARSLAYQVVWPSRRGVEAGVTLVKPYTRTWVAFQLARQHGEAPVSVSGRQILRDVLLHGFEYPLRDPDFDWFVTWVQDETRFSRHLIHDLVHRYVDRQDLVDVTRFRALQVMVEGAASLRTPDVEVGPATDEEIELFVDHLEIARSRPYREAHDLVRGRLSLSGVREAWRSVGFERDRAFLVARRSGVPQAVAVLETAQEGVHLFGLFDAVRLYTLEEGGAAAFGDLVAAAAPWYERHGKRRYVVFLEEPWDFSKTGLLDLGEAELAVVSASLHPDQLEHAWEITAATR